MAHRETDLAPPHCNGAAAALALIDAAAQRARVRTLVGRITDRRRMFRGVLAAHRRDLAELVSATSTDAGDVLAMLDVLPRNVDDLLYYASGGTHDAHATVADKTAATK